MYKAYLRPAAASSGSATTTSSNELIVGANTVYTGDKGPGPGFTSRIITSPDGDIAEDMLVTATGTYAAYRAFGVERELGHAAGDV